MEKPKGNRRRPSASITSRALPAIPCPRAASHARVALADKLDALAGMFGIGQQPTGEKDPFGLRRAALGVIRILVERKLPLSLHELASPQGADAAERFIFERFAGYLKEQGFSTLQVDAVLSQRPARLDVVPQQLEAVKAFETLPEAESLAAANKRVANILKQAAAKGESFGKARAQGTRRKRRRFRSSTRCRRRPEARTRCSSAATMPAISRPSRCSRRRSMRSSTR